MLSLAKVSTGAQAANYYESTDDYYHRGHAPSAWTGEGAQRLGLTGEVDADVFRKLLDGQMPDGSTIHNAAEGRRGGTDFTFSAPKSVSMQTLIGDDVRLIDAHQKAVARTLDYAQGLAAYRVTEGGHTRHAASDNLLIATFRHDLSRDADPQLHTHAVVINATQRPDGQWRALEQSEFYRQQKLMGALYRSELALEVQKLGYDIRLTHSDGRFELAHVTPTQVEAFSTRSRSIEAALAAQGTTREEASARQKEVATLATRDKKVDVDRHALHELWRDKSQVLGIDYRPTLNATAPPAELRGAAARPAVAFAIEHTTERQAIVNHAQLMRAALERGTGKTDLQSIQAEIVRASQFGTLIRVGERYTTQAAQTLEREMLALEQQGRGVLTPIMDRAQAERLLAALPLNDEQRAAATLVVASDARVSAIQGSAGTGKTTMLRHATELAEAQGYRVIGLAPSGAAARELGKSGIESQTLAAFRHHDSVTLSEKSLIVIDEAGMVATKDMHHVLHKAEAANARIVLVGDVQQLKAIEAGRPFAQLQEAGMVRVEMGEIQRQRDPELKHAVELAAKGETVRSLAALQHHIIEIPGNRERYQAIAKDFAMLDAETRRETLIVAGTHAARTAINDNVRAELGLAGSGITVTALERKDLTDAQTKSSLSYQSGDIVQAQKHYDSLGLRRGEMAMVVEGAAGCVMLERDDGERVQWRPVLQPKMTAYHAHEREFAVGDQVRISANDHGRDLINGDQATVQVIDRERQTITLQKTDGSEIKLDAVKPLHLDHGYCSTVHVAQGQTRERVLIEADTTSLTSNESAYYVAISRAREEVTLYTDDKLLLPEALGREDTKAAALDLQRESEAVGMER